MRNFTLLGTNVGTTVGAPDIDLYAPTDVAVSTDGKMPIVGINVSSITTGITTKSNLVLGTDERD